MIDRKLSHIGSVVLIALTAVTLLAACTPPSGGDAAPTANSGPGDAIPAPPTSTPTSASNVTNYTSLSAALRDLGISPFPAGSGTYDFMSIAGTKVKCGKEFITVYEYRLESDADKDAVKLQPDGTITDADVAWKSVPHFYRSRRVIVIYDGTDETLLAALNDVMGAPIGEGK